MTTATTRIATAVYVVADGEPIVVSEPADEVAALLEDEDGLPIVALSIACGVFTGRSVYVRRSAIVCVSPIVLDDDDE